MDDLRDVDRRSPDLVMPLYPAIPCRDNKPPVALATSKIDAEITDRLCGLSAQERCDVHEIIYSATVSYLSQLIDQAEITVALSSIGEHSDDVAGPCSYVLAIRNQLDPTGSFIANLSQLTRSLRDAHTDDSSRITSAGQFHGANSRPDGAIVWIKFVTVPTSTSVRDALLISDPSKTEPRLISLSFYFTEDHRPTAVSVTSNNLEDRYARSLIDGLVSFISRVVTSPELSLTRHELISQDERNEILLHWNDTKSAQSPLCIHELFERQVELTPDRPAIEFKGHTLTYAELNRRSNQIAHRIACARSSSKTKQPGDSLVGICVDKSLEMVVALLGTMKAGCAYVPIDPSYPDERIAFLVEDAGINILLTRRHLIGKVENLGRSVICLDDDELAEPAGAIRNIPVEEVNLTPDDPVAVLYTSGSTGKPKGVFISHKGLVSRLQWMRSTFPFTDDEVAGHIAQLPFVRALWELFIPLTGGTKVVIIDLNTAKDPQKLSECIGEHKITRLVTAPSLAQTLVSSAHQAESGLRALKHWFIGGESLHFKVAKAIREALPNVSICNLYGATEVHSFASFYPVIDEPDGSTRVPIGRAISDTAILILDRHKRLLPLGIPGEICVLGDGVASGYLNQPTLTAQKFTDHGFTDAWNSSLYKTGDIGYCLPDRNIMFVGRMDHQVKIRGIRVELGEVETALLTHEEVEKAVVVSHEFDPGDSRLVAYIVPRLCAGKIEAKEWRRRYIYLLRRFLEQKLPPYMIPSYFVILDKLPLNAYGKVLRKELPAPDVDSVGSIGYSAPRNERERSLCEIWEQVLGIDKVGIFDNFFDLGGHSLLAARIKARVNDAFAIELPLRDIFERPNVAELAEAIDHLAEHRSSDLPPLVRVASSNPAPLTEEMKPWRPLFGKPSTLIHFCVRLFGEVDERALGESLAYLIGRHDALRLVFQGTGDDIYIVPGPTAHADLSVFDLRGELSRPDASERSEREMLRENIRDLLSRPSDITSGCLTRWALIRVRPLESVFVGILDHIVVDAASMAILRNELKLVYEAYCTGRQPNLPPLAFGYIDYAHWQERYRATDSYAAEKQAHKEYAQKIYSTFEQLGPRHALDSKSYYHKLHSIDLDTQLEMSDFCARTGITASMFYTAAFHLAVYDSFDRTDILLSESASDRRFPELQDAVGLFVYHRYVRSVLANDMTLLDFIARTKRSVLASFGTGFTHLEPEDLDCEIPVADFHITYRNLPGDGEWELFNLKVEPASLIERLENARVLPVGEKSFKLMLRVERTGTNENVHIFGSGLIFSAASFEAFNERFRLTVRELARVANSSMTIGDLLRREEFA